MIQDKLATGEEDPTDLLRLAKHCQQIKHSIKKVSRSKFLQDRNAKCDAARKNNGAELNKAIVSASGSSAAPAQANTNPQS